MTSPRTVSDLAMLLKVIADETRLRILGAIAEEPLTGKDLAGRLDLTPATISHHMRKLVDAGIVTSTSDASVSGIASTVISSSRHARYQ